MISLEEAIQSGEFYLATWVDDYEDQAYSVQMKFNDFYKLDLSKIDDDYIDDVDGIDLDSNFWVLGLSLVNLNKQKYDLDDLRGRLKIFDEEGYEFEVVYDWALCERSKFGRKNNLHKLYSNDLKPKILKSGSLLIELPEYFESISIEINDGNIEEL